MILKLWLPGLRLATRLKNVNIFLSISFSISFGCSMSHLDKTNLYYHFSQVRVSTFFPKRFLFLKTALHGTEMFLSMSYTICLKKDDFLGA